jgi:hypothetical protein
VFTTVPASGHDRWRSFRLLGIRGEGGLIIAAGARHGLDGQDHLLRDKHHLYAERTRDVDARADITVLMAR